MRARLDATPLRPPRRVVATLALLLGACAAACGSAVAASAGDAGANLPVPPPALERLLRTEPFEIRGREWVAGWVSPVYRVDAHFPSLDRTLAIKWKAAASGLERRNNTPRREIAAYQIQKWFLAPEQYVVPTTIGRCLSLELHAQLDPDVEPNLPGIRCVFGALSIWLENVEVPDPLLEEDRFREDADYARHLADYNLLTYLIENHDTRPANVLVSTHPSHRRVFSIDNGVSFGESIYNVFRSHWNEIRVPALANQAIDRLRGVGEDELRALAVVAEFRTDEGGVLREVPASTPFDVDQGVRTEDGVLQLGLVPGEIEGVRNRLHALLARVDAGEIPVF